MTASRLRVYNTLIRTGLVPVFYMDHPSAAETFVSECLAGGVEAFEFTNRGGAALRVFQHLRTAFPDQIVGIGSILDAPTAALYLAYGADFIVSPVFDADVAELCNRRKVAYIPGCGTATEIHRAEAAGAEIVKLFPASVYGPELVKAIKAPMPQTRIMPTGGIEPTENDIRAWFTAGVSCVGIGSSLQKTDDVSAVCGQVLGWIKRFRREDDNAR